ELVDGARDELGDNLIGVYLVGSLATGDFDADSDVDFLVVTEEEISEENVLSLQAMHTRIHGIGCYPAQHLKGSCISRDVLNRPETVGVRSKLAGKRWAMESLDPAWKGFIQGAWREREGVRHCIKIRQLADRGVLRETNEFIQYAIQLVQAVPWQ
ncbi:MAG: nucleotidyltransferase domain-containing protein, partial [Candidatus Fermentibacteraceae bacterium]|nr:nucleotidyltransferase domain-containing protein [Candidatus Fermentibacteraceae bacterium]